MTVSREEQQHHASSLSTAATSATKPQSLLLATVRNIMDTVIPPISAQLQQAGTGSLNARGNLNNEYNSLSNSPDANRFPLPNLANISRGSSPKHKHRDSFNSVSSNSSSGGGSKSSFKKQKSTAVIAPLEPGSCCARTDPQQVYDSSAFSSNLNSDGSGCCGGVETESVPVVSKSLTTTTTINQEDTTTITTASLTTTTTTTTTAIPNITSNPASTTSNGAVTAEHDLSDGTRTSDIPVQKNHNCDVRPSTNCRVSDDGTAAFESCTGQSQRHVSETGPHPGRRPSCKFPAIPAPAVASTSTSVATSIPLSFTPKGACCGSVVDDRTASDIILHVTHTGDNTQNHSSSIDSRGSFSRSSSFSVSVSGGGGGGGGGVGAVRGGCLGDVCDGGGKYCTCYSKGSSSCNSVGFKGCGCGGGGVTGDRVNFFDCLCTGTTELDEDLPYTAQLRGQEDSHSIW